ncbi:MAG TPA: hypothetical protein VFN31_03415 [Candidatus Saccharimonadales bacterium]|nr:hypothetical protein [Candidatus Saccharimonadales bacterium]
MSGGNKPSNLNDSIEAAAREDVEHVFNDDFREELRNRGRLNFENIINENAMFLQQDLRLTIAQINDYMKGEITSKLQTEFEKYEQGINDAKQLAIESLQKTNQAIEEERQKLSEQIQADIDATKRLLIERFENNMTDIVNHYLLAAIGDQIDLNDQLDFIIADLETNKAAIIEDLKNGA